MFEYTTPLIGGLLIGATAVALLYLLAASPASPALSGAPCRPSRTMPGAGSSLSGCCWAGAVSPAERRPQPAPSALPWWQAVAGGLLVGFGVNWAAAAPAATGSAVSAACHRARWWRRSPSWQRES